MGNVDHCGSVFGVMWISLDGFGWTTHLKNMRKSSWILNRDEQKNETTTQFFIFWLVENPNYPPVNKHSWLENGPGMKMYFLLKMGIFQPAMLVYQRVHVFYLQIPRHPNSSWEGVWFWGPNASSQGVWKPRANTNAWFHMGWLVTGE